MTSSPSIIFTLAATEDGEFVTVYAPGRAPLPADNTHPRFEQIKARCLAALGGEQVDPDEVADLFDVADTVERNFQRLSDRVAVKGGQILLDGDPVNGDLQEQILDFLDAGDDFGPLVNFYEKLVTNPLGDVRESLFRWIRGQKAEGNFTITPEGDVIGYKSVKAQAPEWRDDAETVYVPSRRGIGVVNGRDVAANEFIEQVPGDVVEMPRSKVLHAPSQACGDGLHIGTFNYAKGFYGGDTVMLVKFSPRDIVSVPDSNSEWKIRVCRYTVLGPVTEPLDVPLYVTEDEKESLDTAIQEAGIDLTFEQSDDGALAVGDRVKDDDGDEGTLESDPNAGGTSGLRVRYDDKELGTIAVDTDEVSDDGANAPAFFTRTSRAHGKGGATSQAAKGNGRNPAQDNTGKFVNGRPNSARDASTGRFA